MMNAGLELVCPACGEKTIISWGGFMAEVQGWPSACGCGVWGLPEFWSGEERDAPGPIQEWRGNRPAGGEEEK